ncbi:hypothetical protein EW146_g6950 [Bondarzewia mesenterica]|uniref:Cytochrome P450 n=1 Tax=Bondarzewia mesenterica TaxID=1095465 RepID=A0A4V3XEE1_9AGAM|nr:hypothetical protein EW146_g6950 [Bondarzewia mesenterica]
MWQGVTRGRVTVVFANQTSSASHSASSDAGNQRASSIVAHHLPSIDVLAQIRGGSIQPLRFTSSHLSNNRQQHRDPIWLPTIIYGVIIYIHAFGNSVIVLNSAKAADNLLEKRGAIYSSRPERAMIRDVMGWNCLSWECPMAIRGENTEALFRNTSTHVLLLAMNRFRSGRLTRSSATCFTATRTIIIICAGEAPGNAAALVMKISYGHDVAEEGDVFVTLAERAISNIMQAGIFGAYLVDYIPMLKHVPHWFPGAGFKRQGREWMKDSRAMLDKPYELVKEQMASGTAGPSVMTIELENLSSSKDVDITTIKNIAAISYAAGADTTVSTMMTFFLSMMLHPEYQRKAQEEIDRVVGPGRLPDFNNRDQLPHINNIVWECLRWNPILPLAVPHATTQDDVYEGYWISKGTTIIPNIWAMFHDETKHPDAFAFKPERFEDEKKNMELGTNNLPHIVFGFGRRVCPGRWLAFDSLWITIASVLSVYTVSKPKDVNGAVIEPEIEFTNGVVSRPKTFKCSVFPRSEASLALIKQTEDERDMAN